MVTIRNDLAKGTARGRSLVPRTDALTDGYARQEGELTKSATKAGALADLRSPAGVGNPMYLACTSDMPRVYLRARAGAR